MAHPPFITRLANFNQDALANLESPAPLSVDSELNQLVALANLINLRLRNITNADGTLRNQSTATAQALAGAQRFVATASQTVFTTTIAWSASFTSLNVEAFSGGTRIDSSLISVADSGGFLAVTLPAQTVSTVVLIAAFESGAGILTRLGTAGSATDGANLVAIRDVGGWFVSSTTEGALQELGSDLDALTTSLGSIGGLIRDDGTVPMAANLAMGTHKITGLSAGTASTDAVNVGQLSAYTAVWNALQSYFLRLDGSTPMAADLPMGTHKITGLSAGTAGTDAVNKTQLDAKLALSGGTMTGAIAMGSQLITALADPVSDTDAVNLRTARSLTASFATKGLYQASGTSAFTVPSGISKLKVRLWGAGAGGSNAGSSTLGYGGGAGAYTEATLSVTAGETLTIVIGAGGAANTSGGNSQVLRGATVLMQSNGGTRGDTTGLGGGYTFDGSVTGFGISGGSGGARYINTGAADPVSNTGGIGGDSPCGGPGGRYWIYQPGGPGTQGTGGENGVAPGGGGASFVSSAGTGAAGACVVEY